MEGVAVHRNSTKPAMLNALAFAAGRNIYLGPGQENLLSHEAWHIAQQGQGRVARTGVRSGFAVNEDPTLEREAETWQSGATQPAVDIDSNLRNIPSNYTQEAPVIQGYFSAPAQSGSILAGFGKRPPANGENIDEVATYIHREMPFLAEDFENKRQSKDDAGLLTEWVQENLYTTLDEIRLLNIRAQYPQIDDIPDSWISDTHAINDGGPPIIVAPSPQWSPRWDDYSDSSDPSLLDQLLPTDYLIDISQDTFEYHGSFYPITDEHRSDIRASAILDNAFLDFHSAPLTVQSPKTIKVPGTSISKGKRKGEEKSISDLGNDLLRRERARPNKRDRSGYENKVLSHHPDRALWPFPYSSLGFHPQSKTANTLEGDASGLSERIATGRPVRRVVVKEKSGSLHVPTFKNRRSRHINRAGKLVRDRLRGYQRSLDAILEEDDDISPAAANAASLVQDVLDTARQQLGAGESFSLSYYIEQYVQPLAEQDSSKTMRRIQELASAVIGETSETPQLFKF